jgi:hypothetical protein
MKGRQTGFKKLRLTGELANPPLPYLNSIKAPSISQGLFHLTILQPLPVYYKGDGNAATDSRATVQRMVGYRHREGAGSYL